MCARAHPNMPNEEGFVLVAHGSDSLCKMPRSPVERKGYDVPSAPQDPGWVLIRDGGSRPRAAKRLVPKPVAGPEYLRTRTHVR